MSDGVADEMTKKMNKKAAIKPLPETIVEVRGTFVHRIVCHDPVSKEQVTALAKTTIFDIEEIAGIDSLDIDEIEVMHR
jgi:hypothetical protein